MPLSDEELAQAMQEWAESKATASISWSKDQVARVLRDFVRSRGRWLESKPALVAAAPAKLRLPKWAAEAVVAPGIAPEPAAEPEPEQPPQDPMAPTEDPEMAAMRQRLAERARLAAEQRRAR